VAAASVEFRGVTKRYGAVVAVNDVSFLVDRGTLVTLLGPSGCGKTTMLRLIAGLELATSGQILIDELDVTRLSAVERDVSMVFQSYALFPHLTVLENAAYGPLVSGVRRREAQAMAAEKLALVGLTGFEKRMPSELSGGQQQRVALARALVLEPQVLLFDEPLSNLDAKLRRRVREDIRELQSRLGLTVVYVTHDQGEALAVSDRIIVMANAVIAQQGEPRQLYEEPANLFVADFIGEANLVPAELSAVHDGRGRIRLGTLDVDAACRDGAPGPVTVAIRPDAILLHPQPPSSPALPARILKTSYLGTHFEYAIESPLGELFVIDRSSTAGYQPGSDVWISLTERGVVVVKDRYSSPERTTA
jgi:iron(III) transport system ATP-binding protein